MTVVAAGLARLGLGLTGAFLLLSSGASPAMRAASAQLGG